MDMDDEAYAKPSQPARTSTTKLTVPKLTLSVASATTSTSATTTTDQATVGGQANDGLIESKAPSTVSIATNSQPKILILPQASRVAPKTPVNNVQTNSNNSLKFKLNLSGEAVKLESKPNENISKPSITPLKMTINPSITTIANTGKLTGPIKIISNDANSQKNTIVLKLKSDGSESKYITPVTNTLKRPLEITTPPETTKIIKIEATKPGETTKPMITTPQIISSSAKTVKVEPPRKVFITKAIAPKFEPIVKPVSSVPIAPIKQVNASPIIKEVKPKPVVTPKKPNIVAATTKIVTLKQTLPTNVIPTQEPPKRVNQRARVSTARPNSPLPRGRTSTARRSTARRAKLADKDIDHDADSVENEKEKKKPAVSAYVLWCRESRSEMASRYPDLNFIDLSRKMGEIWHTLAQNEKDIWFKKAKLLTNLSIDADELYTQDWISDDLKPKVVSSWQTLPITAETVNTFDETFSGAGSNERVGMLDNRKHQMGTELIDVQAYLTILGDSLETIGSYLQRGVKYNSEIDYSKTTALSTLLDTALVAMGSLTCLTKAIPKIAPPTEKLAKTLDEISLFMPPTDLSYNA